ncbi:MAG: autotransporter assembly complex protein TamB [Enterovibrio sp.]
MKPIIKKVAKWSAISASSLVLLGVGGVGTLLFTNSGIDVVLWGAKKALPTLNVGRHEGRLLDGFTLEDVSLQLDGVDFKLKQLALDISSACLTSKQLCVENLQLEGLNLVLAQMQESQEEPPAEPLSEILAPLPIYLRNLTLNDAFIDAMGTQIRIAHFSSAAEWQGDTATLLPTKLHGIAINLPKTPAAPPATPAAAKEPAQAIVLPEVLIPLRVDVQDLLVTDFKLDDQPMLHKLQLQAEAFQHNVQIKKLQLDTPQADLDLAASVNLTDSYPLTLNAKAKIKLDPIAGHNLKLDASGSLDDLDLAATLSGVLRANLKANMDVLDPKLPFSFSLDSRKLQWPLDKAQFNLANTKLAAKGSLNGYDANLSTSFSGTDLPSVKLQTAVRGNLDKVALPNLAIETLGGTIKGSVEAGWKDQVAWKTALRLDNIQPGKFDKNLEGNISGSLQQSGHLTKQGGWYVDVPKLDITGILREQKLSLNASARAQDVKGNGNFEVNLPNAVLKHGQNYLAVKGKLDKNIALDVDLDFPSFASSLPQARGSAKGKVAIAGTLEKPKITLQLKGNQLGWEKLVSIDALNLRGSLDPLPKLGGSLAADLQGLKAEGVELKNLVLRASGNEQKHDLSLAFDGKPLGSALTLSGSLVKDKWQGNLTRTDLMTELGTWRLVKAVPITLDLANNAAVKVGSLCLQQNSNQICVDEVQNRGDKGNAKLSIKYLDFAILKPFLPKETKLDAKVRGQVDAAWQAGKLPQVAFNLGLNKGSVTQTTSAEKPPLVVGWDKIDLAGTLKDDKLNSQLQLKLTKNGSVGLDFAMQNMASNAPDIKSDFTINRIDLSLLKSLLDDQAKLTGMLDGKVSLSGKLESMQARGKIGLTKLSLQSQAVPVEVKDGQIMLNLNGHTGTLDGSITTPEGSLQLKGQGNWRDMSAWTAGLNVSSQKLKVVVPPMVSLDLTTNMTLDANPERVNVNGNVTIPRGRIIVENLPASAVQGSSDLILLDEALKPVTPPAAPSININARVKVAIGNDVTLQAFGLKTQLAGALDVTSDRKGVNVRGEMKLEDGTYRAFGQDLIIQKGQILFSGPPDQPHMNVEAIRNPDAIEDGVEAGLRVTGSASAPKVAVFAKPAMSQANALSYLVRGRSVDAGSDSNGVTSMLIGFGLSQSGKVVGKIGEAFGVQDLALDTSGAGDDEKIEVSGYLLPGLQVKYGVGIFTNLPEFSLRYRLMRNLYVEVVSGVDNAVDLLYQFNIK